jgi:hypothetical protein
LVLEGFRGEGLFGGREETGEAEDFLVSFVLQKGRKDEKGQHGERGTKKKTTHDSTVILRLKLLGNRKAPEEVSETLRAGDEVETGRPAKMWKRRKVSFFEGDDAATATPGM